MLLTCCTTSAWRIKVWFQSILLLDQLLSLQLENLTFSVAVGRLTQLMCAATGLLEAPCLYTRCIPSCQCALSCQVRTQVTCRLFQQNFLVLSVCWPIQQLWIGYHDLGMGYLACQSLPICMRMEWRWRGYVLSLQWNALLTFIEFCLFCKLSYLVLVDMCPLNCFLLSLHYS